MSLHAPRDIQIDDPRAAVVRSLRAVTTEDLEEFSRFLLRIHSAEAATFAEPHVLAWKYLHPRPDWEGSRGFLLESRGHVEACGGVVPAVFRLPQGGTVSSATIIDWAADASIPGVGVALLNKLLARIGSVFIVGGAPVTRRILPKIGFRHVGTVQSYVQWVRPWKEFRTRPKTVRSALRLAHGLVHTPRVSNNPLGDWDTLPVSDFDDSLEQLLSQWPITQTCCERRVQTLNHMLHCPAIKMKGFLLRRQQSPIGYFILGKTQWEGRIVDMFVASEKSCDLKLAYAAATRAILCEPEVCRIRAWATSAPFSEALIANGFWLQEQIPIMIKDRSNLLLSALPLGIQMFDTDAGYLTDKILHTGHAAAGRTGPRP